MPNLPPSIHVWDVGPKIKNLTQISEYKRPAGAYPLGDFYYLGCLVPQSTVFDI